MPFPVLRRAGVCTPVAAVLGVAILCRLSLALLTYGTNDAAMWESSAARIRQAGTAGIYGGNIRVTGPGGEFLHYQIYNHPPFMTMALAGLNRFTDITGIPVRKALRLADAAADAITILLTAAILRAMFGFLPLRSFAFAALSPSWLFISGFHGNSDPIMVCLLVATVWLLQVRARTGWASIAFAFATGIKIVPVLLLPALLLYLRTWRDRLLLLFALAVFWGVTALPWLLQSPQSLFHKVFGYRSFSQPWGLNVIGQVLGFDFQGFGTLLSLAAVIGVSVALNLRRGTVVPLFFQFGLVLTAFLAAMPGFGIQYLAWLAPWVAALPWQAALVWIATSGTLCTSLYTHWNGGLPWFFADSKPQWFGPEVALAYLTWLTICWMTTVYPRAWKEVKEGQTKRAAASSC